MFKLHKHQKKQNKAVRKALNKNNHILYGASTGFGKSVAIWDIVGRSLKKGERVLVVAPYRKLIFQLEETFSKYKPHVIMGIINRGDRYSGLVLSSMDTMNNRLKRGDKYFEGFDLIIIDEAHISCNFPPADNSRMKKLYDKYWTVAKWIGFSATPIKENGYRLEGWDKTIYKYQTGRLIEMGYLADYTYKAPKSIDLSSLRVSNTGDFVKSDMENVTNTPSAIKSVKKLWLKKGQDKKVLIFSSTIHHANLLMEAIPNSKVIHSKLKESEIQSTLDNFRADKKGVLINVDMLTTGFDDPTINMLIIARPIKSERVFIQVCGRVLRKHGDKKAIIYDMCDCYTINGLPCDLRDYNRVKGEAVERDDDDKEILVRNKKCDLCNEVNPIADFLVEKITKKKFLIKRFYCPNCERMCDEQRTDLKKVDEYQTVERTKPAKKLSFKERKDFVAELITEFTKANQKWSHYIVTTINVTGRTELLEQIIAKDTTNATKWKNIMKLYESANIEKGK
jgi:superfamily II DNA or RNA helicase